MATPDSWGLTPQPVDPPAVDPELGHTTDGDGWGLPVAPVPVTRTAFAMSFAYVTYGLLRLVVCKSGVHRRRKHL